MTIRSVYVSSRTYHFCYGLYPCKYFYLDIDKMASQNRSVHVVNACVHGMNDLDVL